MKKKIFFFTIPCVFIFMLVYTDIKVEMNGREYTFTGTDRLIREIELFNISISNRSLTVKAGEHRSDINGDDIDLRYEIPSFSVYDRMKLKIGSFFGMNYSHVPELIYNRKKMSEFLDDLSEKIRINAVNAEILKKKGFLFLKGSRPGKALDAEKSESKMINAFDDGKMYVDLPVIEVTPADDISVLKIEYDIHIPISSYMTEFDPENIDRVHNLKLAADSLNRLILKPGQKFSFNRFLGDRTYDKGYKDAGVVVNGRIVKGVAGGICQITSTLYNALLLADVEIIQRYSHSIYDEETAYTPPGFDSAVAYPYKDLVFRNSHDQNILIEFEFKVDEVRCTVSSGKKPGYEVKLVSGKRYVIPFSTQEIMTDKLSKGDIIVESPGVNGCIVESFIKRVYPDGREEKSFLHRDDYRKYDRKIKKGIK